VTGSNDARPRLATHIAVVDDDPRLRAMLARYLTEEGFKVSEFADGAALRNTLAGDDVDLFLLDLVMPGDDGFTLAREIRARSRAGIIMLTGRADVIDRVAGLEVGADDYIAKPFHLRELLARCRSVLRRTHLEPTAATPPSEPADDALCFDGWELQPEKRRLLSPAGGEVPLTSGEFDLLMAFVKHAGRVLDRERLMDLTKGRNWAAFDRSIDQQVVRLRRKIETDPSQPALIKSVRGAGYTFAAQVRRRSSS
jgi:DNA-binding response OmpR family regulator